MKLIRTINPKIFFYVQCADHEIKKATDLANSIAEKLVAKNPDYKQGATSRFSSLKLLEQYEKAIQFFGRLNLDRQFPFPRLGIFRASINLRKVGIEQSSFSFSIISGRDRLQSEYASLIFSGDGIFVLDIENLFLLKSQLPIF